MKKSLSLRSAERERDVLDAPQKSAQCLNIILKKHKVNS